MILLVFLISCGPRLDSKDPSERYAAVQKLTDQDMLAKIVSEDQDMNVRKAAISRLTDQRLLAKIVIENYYNDIYKAAFDKITDQNVLAQIVIETINKRHKVDPVTKVRIEIGMLKEEWDLFEKAIQKINNQTLLMKIAGNGSYSENVCDQSWSGWGRLSCIAFEKLTNQTLAQCAIEVDDAGFRHAAVWKLTDKLLLSKVAIEAKDALVRRAVVDKLDDKTLLAQIAAKDEDKSVRYTAALRLGDQASLAQVALEDEDKERRRESISSLIDQTVLAKIAINNKDDDIREVAVSRLTDQALLAKFATNDKSENVHLAAYLKIKDKDLAAKIRAEVFPIVYKNEKYQFSFDLPASWKGYTIITEKENGGPYTRIIIRHPKWTEEVPYEDIPIMIFTLSLWKKVESEELIVSAAPFPPGELGRNKKYVFALPPRYNYDFSMEYEEVEAIIRSHSLQAYEGK